MGTRRKRWIVVFLIVILLAAIAGWIVLTRPEPLREVYAVQAWDAIGSLNTARMMPSELTLIDGDRLLTKELLADPRVFDLKGNLLWEFSEPGEQSMYCTAGPDGSIYVGTNKNNVYAFAPDYKLTWQFYAEGSKQFMCCPQPGADGRVYVTATDGVMYALSPEGEELWHVEADNMSGRQPPLVLNNGTVIAPCRDGMAIAYDANGVEQWHINDLGIGLVVPGNPEMIAGIGFDRHVTGWTERGSPLWRSSFSGSVYYLDNLVADDHLLLKLIDKDKLVSLDSMGQVQWDYECDALFTRYCALPDGRTLLVETPTYSSNPVFHYLQGIWYMAKNGGVGRLVLLDSQGQELDEYPLPFMFATSQPVLLPDGTVLVVGNNGMLYRYEIP